ncbi:MULTISPECIES: porin [unclassified Marinovum]
MKNILFATTALVATASFASAEVSGSGPGTINITGSAEMGVMGGESIDMFGPFAIGTTDVDAQFHTDIDITFAMTGTADNGLTFGASVDLDEGGAGAAAHANDADDGGATMFVSVGGATLTMGDTNGALDQVMREVNYAGGSLGDNEEHIAFGGFGNNGLDGFYDGQIARFDYAFDGFTGSLSAEIDDSGNDNPVWGLGARYSGEMSGVSFGVGLGYQAVSEVGTVTFMGFPVGTDASVSLVGLSVDAGFSNGVTAGFTYTVADIDGDEATHGALGLGYEMNALAIGVNYGHYTIDGDEYTSGFGLAASYDLGGGLSAQAGYGASTVRETFTASGDDENGSSWSLGLAMSF